MIAILGTGKMGEALMSGLLRAGRPPSAVIAGVRREERGAELHARYGVRVADAAQAAKLADTLVLAVSAVTVATVGPGRLSLDWLIFGKNWLDGWQGLLLSVGLGLAGAFGQLLIFYRPPAKQAG